MFVIMCSCFSATFYQNFIRCPLFVKESKNLRENGEIYRKFTMAEVEQYGDNAEVLGGHNAISNDKIIIESVPGKGLGADMSNPAFQTISLHYLDLNSWEDVKEGINQNTEPPKGAKVEQKNIQIEDVFQ